MSGVDWTVLDNSNIVESYPGITLPLTYSFIKIAYRGVFAGVIGANLKNDTVLAKYDDILDNMIKSHNGRIYYCINNWYTLIDLMPFSKKIIPVWQDMMGVQNLDVDFSKRHNLSMWQKAKFCLNIAKNSLLIPREMKRLSNKFEEVKNYFDENYRENLSVTELLSLFHEIEHKVMDKWYVTLSNDMYAFIWTGFLKRKLKKKDVEINGYISGIRSLESLKPIRALLEIAQKHGNDANLQRNNEVQEYIKLYGDRSPCELKLEVMTYREDPSLLEQQIREYAKDKTKLDEMLKNLQYKETASVEHGFILNKARLGIRNREISRLNRSRIYGMVRRIFITIGENLHKDGHIEEPFDVFYLEIGEIQNGNTDTYRQMIANRKDEYGVYERLPAQSRLVFRGDALVDENAPANWTKGFTGIGTSAGCITAEAVVIESPMDNVDVKGKIIVTKTTDPGWVFLLAMASGIVAEKGSLLSHTAIVSRELKIPAVVAVDNAAAVIKTGDIIKIDGETGRVEIVQAN